MDGKSNAEDLIAKVLKDPALLQSLTNSGKPTDAGDETSSDATEDSSS